MSYLTWRLQKQRQQCLLPTSSQHHLEKANIKLSFRVNDSSKHVIQKADTYSDVQEDSPLVCLPTEVLHVIAQFLSLKALLSCSASCSRLRAVFNDNTIWRRFCKPYIVRYIQNAQPKVNLDYCLSFLDSEIDKICTERECYIRQNQLLNNWKNGKFVEHTIHSSSGLYYMNLKSGTPIIYEDIYLFLYDFYAHTIVVWNIEDVPVQYTTIRLLYDNYFYEGLYFEIVGKKLVVLEVGKLIQIYDIHLPHKTLPLTSIILVDKNEPLHKVPEFTNPEELYTLCYHRITGSKIFSYKLGKPILHVWDIEMGRKVISIHAPKQGRNFYLLNAANNENDLILCLETNDSERQFNVLGRVYEVYYYSYSRDFFKSLWTNNNEFSLYFPFHAIQHEDLVILFCKLHDSFIDDSLLSKTVLVIYDQKWDVIIAEKSFPELVCHEQSMVVNNQLLLATTFCIYLMDLNTHDIEYSFKFDNGKIELLDVFDGNFIVTTPKSLLTMSKRKVKEVWDIRNRRRCAYITHVFSSPYSKDSVFVNQSFTKMIFVGKGTLGILNFW